MKHSQHDGTGTVLFIHGYQDTAALWNEVIDRLPSPGWSERAVNLRHVDTGRTPRRGAILDGYRDQVLDVLGDIDPAAQHPVVIVGQSMGAQVAELVAAARPNIAAGLVLITPVPLAGYPLTPEQADRFSHAAHDRTVASAGANRRALLVNDSAGVVRTLVSATLATPPVTAVQELEAWTAGHPLGDRPSAVSAPVLLIDSDDTFSSTELIRDTIAPRFADVRIVHVAGAGHWPHVEQPVAVTEILTRFLTSLPRQTAAAAEHQPRTERIKK
jgi:pimeloyl-ACP methyl ester carboxylesterase